MKKAIPVIIAIILIIVILGVSFGGVVYERYSYGQDRADLNEYFEIYSSEDVPIFMQNERIDRYAKLLDGGVYFDISFIKEFLTERFYYDSNEELLLYSTATTTYEAASGSKSAVDIRGGDSLNCNCDIWQIKKDTLYIAADFIQKFVNFQYVLYENPNRLQVYVKWEEETVATVKSDTQVRWRAGVKSEILTDVKEGEKVVFIEELDEKWSKVKTSDCFIGYVENSKLKDIAKEIPSVVTTAMDEKFTYLTRDYRINMTWHNMEYPQDGGTLSNATYNCQLLNVISPTWYWLTDNEGNINSIGDHSYVDKAHALDIEVWAAVQNFHSGTNVDTYEVLNYTSRRRSLVNNIVASALEYGIDGINVDFESMDSNTTPGYVQFIRELSLACHENNLVVSVDNYVPTEYTAHYNRAEQALFADYLVIMGYDEHYQGSDVGSVSTVSWMDEGIANTLKVAEASHVINAIPFYTRVWKTTGSDVTSEAVTMHTQNDFIKRNGMETTWDEETNQNYTEMTLGDTLYQIWLEDEDSVRVRLSVMKKYNLGGVASWCLGQETANIWDAIAEYMQ